MEQLKQTPTASIRPALVLTTHINQPNIKHRNNSKQSNPSLNNKSRGLSLGHNLINLRDFSEEKGLKTTNKPLFKAINTFSISQNTLAQENEVLKLQIAELKKENTELKKQNAIYYQHLLKNSNTNTLSTNTITLADENNRLASTFTTAPHTKNFSWKKSIGSIGDNDSTLKNDQPSVELMHKTPQATHKPMISFTSEGNNFYHLKKKVELNQSIEALPSFKRSANKSFFSVQQVKVLNDSKLTNNSIISVQLNSIKEKTKELIQKYRKRLDQKTLVVSMKAIKSSKATELITNA